MPPKGRRSVTRTRPEQMTRRVLRCYSKYTIAENLHSFFHSAPVPNFSCHLLEAYVKAVLPHFEPEPELALKSEFSDTSREIHTTVSARTADKPDRATYRRTKSNRHRDSPLSEEITWTNLDQNIYSNFPLTAQPVLTQCHCISNCNDDCPNRNSRHECITENCTLTAAGTACGNRPFSEYVPRLDNFEIREIDCQGLGLVSTRSYNSDELIIEYCGKITPAKPAATATRKRASTLFLNFVDEYMLDATKHASAARFINHSCQPNAQLQLWYVEGKPRLGVFATNHISPGTQITCDYNAGSFFNYGVRRKLPCHCGSFNCAGYIDTGVESQPVLARKRIIMDDESDDNKSVAEISQNPSLMLVLKYRQPSITPNQTSFQVSQLEHDKTININKRSHEVGFITTEDKGTVGVANSNDTDSFSPASNASDSVISMSHKQGGDLTSFSSQSGNDSFSTGEIRNDTSIPASKKRKVEFSASGTGYVAAHLTDLPESPQLPLFDTLPAVVAQQQLLSDSSPVLESRQEKQEEILSQPSIIQNSTSSSSNGPLSHSTSASVPVSRSNSQLSLSLKSILNSSLPPSTSATTTAPVSYASQTSAPLGLGLHHLLRRSDTEASSSPRDMSISSLLSKLDDEEDEEDEVMLNLPGLVKLVPTSGHVKIQENNNSVHCIEEKLPLPSLPIYNHRNSFINSVHSSGTLRLPLFGSPDGSLAVNNGNNLVNTSYGSWNSNRSETATAEVVVSPKLDLTETIPPPFSSVSYTHLPVTFDSTSSNSSRAIENYSGSPKAGETENNNAANFGADIINTHVTNKPTVHSHSQLASDTTAGWEKISISNLLS